VLPLLVKDEVGVLGMNALGDPFIPDGNTATPIECLHYAMNLPTSTVTTGIDTMEILEQALEAARTFTPLSKEAVASLLARTADAAATGKYELFKTSSRYDRTAHNPHWLG
jgi:ABC-type branched-subunit amino acid transport system substrate-binding protein